MGWMRKLSALTWAMLGGIAVTTAVPGVLQNSASWRSVSLLTMTSNPPASIDGETADVQTTSREPRLPLVWLGAPAGNTPHRR